MEIRVEFNYKKMDPMILQEDDLFSYKLDYEMDSVKKRWFKVRRAQETQREM